MRYYVGDVHVVREATDETWSPSSTKERALIADKLQIVRDGASPTRLFCETWEHSSGIECKKFLKNAGRLLGGVDDRVDRLTSDSMLSLNSCILDKFVPIACTTG